MLALASAAWPTVAANAPEAVASRGPLPGARLAGQGRLTWWGMAVYDARLWAAPGFNAAEFASQPFALELHYLRTLRGEAIARRSLEEMRRAGPIDEAQSQRWERALIQLLPDVKNGDTITGIHVPGRSARFLLNGKPLGEIAEPEFAALFFAIWLGPTTSQPELRSGLLGGAR